MWKRNRFLSAALAGILAAFWLCLRDMHGDMDAHPFLSAVYDPRFQLAAFLCLGFALAWAFRAWAPDSKGGAWLGALGVGAVLVLFQVLYNRVFRRWGTFYVVNPWLQLGGICGGIAACALLMRLGRDAAPEPEIALTDISAQRDRLMGVGMLAVVILHTRSMGVRYIAPLDFVTRYGNIGVDMFLFVSGIGMVYSLSRDANAWHFYKRRARRIYLEAMPWIAAYALICMFMGRYNVYDVIVTSLGIGNLVKGGGFNWYISFILLLYLLTPLFYALLRRRKWRWAWATLLTGGSLAALFLICDVLGAQSLMIAFSRTPVFLIGLLAGFWMKEDLRLTRREYRSMLCLAVVMLGGAYLFRRWQINSIHGGMWLCHCIAAPVICLALARAFGRVDGDGRIMRFLAWSGKNSLLIYVWNILLVRFYSFFISRLLAGAGNLGYVAYAYASVLANYLIVYLIQRLKSSLRRRRRKDAEI